MTYREITPEDRLKPFIKCFYIFHSDSEIEFEDVVFPSGFPEIVFNLGQGCWTPASGKRPKAHPKTELWGQVTKPMRISSKGNHVILGVRFFPHSTGHFINEDLKQFNDSASDLSDILGASITELHARLFETTDLTGRINLIEIYLLNRLSSKGNQSKKLLNVGHLILSINKDHTEDSLSSVAFQHGISVRGLHQLIDRYTGLSPKLLSRIHRFQSSLKLVKSNVKSLTSIAHQCGYFDQSHFIKDFKTFTGVTPTQYMEKQFLISQLLLQAEVSES